MEWFEYPYPRPDLMNKWALARHTEVMGETFETDASKKKFDNEVHSLFKSIRGGKTRAELSSLFECLYAAAKMEEKEDPTCKERASFTKLYSQGLRSLLENYIHNPPCWKKVFNENDIVLYCMALTADLAKCVLKSLHIETKDIDPPQRINNAIAIVRSLLTVVEKDSLFHKLNKRRPLPPWILFHPRKYTKSLSIVTPTSILNQDRSCESLDNKRHACSSQREDKDRWCGCGRCSSSPHESYLWINIVLEHFGSGSGIAGLDVFLDTLVKISHLESTRSDILELCESIIGFLYKIMEFLREEKTAAFVEPCLRVQGAISRWHQTNQLVDESLVGTVTLIARHLRSIFGSVLPSGVSQSIMEKTNKSLRDLLIGFQSRVTSSSVTSSSTASSSPRTSIRGKNERHRAPMIDATTARAIKEEVSRQMRQELTTFVSELLTMLVPKLQPQSGALMKQIMQQSETNGAVENTDCEIARHPNHSLPLAMIEISMGKISDSLTELSPPRSSATLGATMRNATEILSESKIEHVAAMCILPNVNSTEPVLFLDDSSTKSPSDAGP